MAFIVQTPDASWFLRSTVWAGALDRAQRFQTKEAAQAQLDKAKQFMKVRTYKAAQIVEIINAGGAE